MVEAGLGAGLKTDLAAAAGRIHLVVAAVAAVAAEDVAMTVVGDVVLVAVAAAAETAETLYHLEDLCPMLRCYFQNQRFSYRQSL